MVLELPRRDVITHAIIHIHTIPMDLLVRMDVGITIIMVTRIRIILSISTHILRATIIIIKHIRIQRIAILTIMIMVGILIAGITAKYSRRMVYCTHE